MELLIHNTIFKYIVMVLEYNLPGVVVVGGSVVTGGGLPEPFLDSQCLP